MPALAWLRLTFVNEVDDVLRGSAGEEDFGDAGSFEGRNIRFGDDAAHKDGQVVHTFFVEKFHELRAEGVVGSGEDREPNDVDVFLGSCRGDHFRRLSEAGIDDLHPGVTESTGDDLGAAVVAVEAGLGNQHANFLF